jgi:DNA-binding MarR family transcriptional regulator
MKDVNHQAAGKRQPIVTPCLCSALRQASRAVTRIYDAELRGTGLRATQHSLLGLLGRSGEVRQGDLGEMVSLDETTLTRSLRPLQKSGWVTIRAGADRREKLVAITEAGKEKVEQARPAWSRAQERMRRTLPDETWDSLFAALPDVTKAAASEDKIEGTS